MEYSQEPTSDQSSHSTDQVKTSEQSEGCTIVRTPMDRDHPYVIFPRDTAQDERLSFEARGMLLYLKSKPPGWQVRLIDLQKQGGIKLHATRSILRELETYGYLSRHRKRNALGKFWWEIIIYWYPADNPQFQLTTPPSPEELAIVSEKAAIPPCTENPPMAEPPMAEPPTDNPPIYKVVELQNKELQNKEHTQTPAPSAQKPVGVVGVCSKFSLQEISRYVAQCQAQGQTIHSPQGLAISLQRSGRADAMIEAYLHPSTQTEAQAPPTATKATPADIRDCPDCRGTGWWYPEGFGERVRRCKHERLTKEAEAAA